MNILKRSLAMMLVLCMLFSIAPITAFAEETTDSTGTVMPADVDGSSGSNTTADQPTADQPTADQPTADQPTADQPTADQPTADQPTADQPTADQPTADQPTADQPTADQPTADQPTADQPTADQPTADQPTADQPTADEDEEDPYGIDLADYETTDVTLSYRILHLDCGRKYFTKDWIIALINEMSAAGYNQLQLAFGNDGLRFLLDDMSFTANSTTYDHATVVSKVEAGNAAQNSSGDSRWLTQAEMDSIITHANSKGIEIVPLLNLPGHANAILDIADDAYNASGSNNTLDVANSDAAQAFGMAILKKYVNYFAGKGCKFFSFGADEYANDASGSFSFSRLNSAQYAEFVEFINEMTAYIESKGMTARAFNDGLYYNGQDVTADTDIQCCYWSSGWSGYSLASASTISNKGHAMINTHGDYYYVLGKTDHWDEYGYTYASDWDNTVFVGSTVNNPAGSMFCIWCDFPGAETENQIAANTRLVLRAMAAEMQGYDAASINMDVVSGGFNADGTINGTATEEPTPQLVTKTESNVSVTAYDLTGLTVATAEAPTVEGASSVLAWDITPATADGSYTGRAEVTLPVPAEWTNVRGGVLASEHGEEVMDIQGTLANGYFTFTVPHFSNVVAYELDSSNITNTVTVRIPVGGTSQTYTDNTGNYEDSATIEDGSVAEMHVSGKAGAAETTVSSTNISSADELTDGATFIIRVSDTSYALTSNKGGTTWGNADGDTRAFEYYSVAEADNMWTLEASGNGYKLKSAAGYLNLGLNAAWVTQSGGDTFTFTYSNGGWAIGDGTYNIDALGGLTTYYCAGGWQNSGTRFDLYKVTTSAPASTEVSFKGLKIGTTTAIVGTTQYNIEVLDPNNVFTKEEYVEVPVNETITITDNTGNYEASYTGTGLDTTIANVAVKGTTVEGQSNITPVTTFTTGDTFYIQVSEGVYRTANGGTTTNFAEAELWKAENTGDTYLMLQNTAGKYLCIVNGTLSLGNYANYYFYFYGGVIYDGDIIVGTPVKVEVTTPVDATEITITGVSKGETKVIVGETRYNITVIGTTDITIKYQTEGGTTVKIETVTVAENATTYTVSNFTHTDGKFYVVDNATLTITPATNTTYTVTVTEADVDLSAVTPLTIEYFITNQMVTIDGVTSKTLQAIDVYSEAGVAFADLVPASDGASENPKVLWRGWLLPDGYHQEHENTSPDMCTDAHGTQIEKLRYWGDESQSWQYFDGTEWKDIRDTDQIAAYYLQQTEITDEVTTDVTDWGQDYAEWKAGIENGWFWDGYVESGSKYVFMDFAVVYEDGTQVPGTDAFPVDDTWFFHFDVPAGSTRVMKPIVFEETSTYKIWKVTVTDGTSTGFASASTFESTYDDTTETVVWTEEMGGQAGIEDLTYTENRSGKLIRVYVKAVETEDTLTVVYFDEKFGDTLYTYYISVPNGSNFNENIVRADTTGIDAPPEFADGSGRINVTGYGIVNALDKTQNFQTDLTLVPQAVGKYNSDLYTYTGSEISADGKTLYLYYNIDTDVLSPNYVVDFGLPITFPLTDVVGVGQENLVESVTVNEKTRYGTLTYSNGTFTYTPTTILQNIDVLTINIKFTTETAVSTTNVGVTPATTVHYEASFLENESGWTTVNTSTAKQTTEVLGEKYDAAGNTVGNNYGYQPGYTGGNYSTADKIGATTGFTFTGTGVDIYANCLSGTGYVAVRVKNAATGTTYLVNTVAVDGTTNATTGQTTINNAPIVSTRDLPYGEYDVIITKVMDSNPVQISGFRVYNTMQDSSIFNADKEDYPNFYELRDLVLTALEIGDTTSEDYGTVAQMSEQVYEEFVTASSDKDSNFAVVLNNNDTTAGSATPQDLLDNGPKNELFLRNGETLVFDVTTSRDVQIGLKAPSGDTTYTINGGTEENIATSVDMFYDMGVTPGTSTTYTFTITNTGDNILSVTLLKVCDDPSFAFTSLTASDIEKALYAMGYTDAEPEKPIEPEAPTYTMVELKGTDVLIDGTVFDYTGEPIEPAITVNVGGTQLVEGKDYSVTYTNNVEPGTATVTIRGIATASETLGYTGEVSIDYTINAPAEPEVPETVYADAVLNVVLVDYAGKRIASADLTANGAEGETAVFTADEILAAAKSQMPGNYALVSETASNVEVVYGESEEVSVQVGKVATLKITFVSLLGKKVGSATITRVQTASGYCRISASEINGQVPSGRHAFWFLPATVSYGSTTSIVIPVI